MQMQAYVYRTKKNKKDQNFPILNKPCGCLPIEATWLSQSAPTAVLNWLYHEVPVPVNVKPQHQQQPEAVLLRVTILHTETHTHIRPSKNKKIYLMRIMMEISLSANLRWLPWQQLHWVDWLSAKSWPCKLHNPPPPSPGPTGSSERSHL